MCFPSAFHVTLCCRCRCRCRWGIELGNLDTLRFSHNSCALYGESCAPGDVISVTVNLDRGTLEFARNGRSFGVAFADVIAPVFPVVYVFTSPVASKAAPYKPPAEVSGLIQSFSAMLGQHQLLAPGAAAAAPQTTGRGGVVRRVPPPPSREASAGPSFAVLTGAAATTAPLRTTPAAAPSPSSSSSPRADGCVKLLVKPKVVSSHLVRAHDLLQLPSMPPQPARLQALVQPQTQATPSNPPDDASKAVLAQVRSAILANLRLGGDYEVGLDSYRVVFCVKSCVNCYSHCSISHTLTIFITTSK